MVATASPIGIAKLRSVYRCADVEQRLARLQGEAQREHEPLRHTYERMLERGAERFQVKPAGLPAMEHLYDELPNFHAVLDDVKRQLALTQDSGDALELAPMLLLGPPGVGKTHFAVLGPARTLAWRVVYASCASAEADRTSPAAINSPEMDLRSMSSLR